MCKDFRLLFDCIEYYRLVFLIIMLNAYQHCHKLFFLYNAANSFVSYSCVHVDKI